MYLKILFSLTSNPFHFLSSAPSLGIRLDSISVPPYEVVGDEVTLKCDFELEDDKLYSVTWYRDNDAFYQYVPSSRPRIVTFTQPGIQVDVRIYFYLL